MTTDLILTRDEADRLDTDGRVVLFRSPARCSRCNTGARFANEACWQCRSTGHNPPAEFVEAAKPCETCEGRGFNMIQLSPTSQEVSWCTNPDCLDGRRRITVAVSCDNREWIGGSEPVCSTCGGGGLVTVGHVVVESGPDRQDDGQYALGIRDVNRTGDK